MPVTPYVSVIENYFPVPEPSKYPGPEQKRFAVTDKQVITRLAAMVNALPVAKGVVMTPCAAQLAPAYELDFGASAGTATVAQVSVECFGVLVTVDGKSKPTLSLASVGQQQFLREVGSVLAGSTAP